MRKHGFTIVEIMIVVAIIGLIFAMIMPALAKKANLSNPAATGNALYRAEKVDVFPEASGYVVDQVGLLSPEDKVYIENTCKNLDSIGQVAVCIISTTGNMSIEDYSIRLAEKWKVGHKDKDDGVILVIAKNDRKMRIEVGRGNEDVKLTDARAGRIINNVIVPKFKSGQYSQGVRDGVDAIFNELKGVTT